MPAATRITGRLLRRRLPGFVLTAIVTTVTTLVFALPATAASVATTTSLILDKSSAQLNEPVTMTATVTAASGTASPTGSVSFQSVASDGTKTTIATAPLSASGIGASTATVTISSLAAGSYQLVASYGGAFLSFSSSTSSAVSLSVGGAVIHNTTTQLSADNTSPTAGDPITFTAHVFENDGGVIVPTGTVTFRSRYNNSSSDELLGQANIDANGNATLPVAGLSAGTYQITAEYTGDRFDHGSSDQMTLVVSPSVPQPVDTSTSVSLSSSMIQADGNGSVTITAQVVQLETGAIPDPSDHIDFYATKAGGGQIFLGQGVMTWDADGVNPATGTSSITVSGWLAGTYDISASFIGDAFNHNSSDSTTLVVTSASPSTLTYTGDASVLTGSSASVQFQLADENGVGIPSDHVSISVNGQTYDVTTDADGFATVNVTLPLGTYPVTATFAGDGIFLPTTGSGSIVVTKIPTSVVYTGDTNAAAGRTATLSATLLDSSGNPVGGKLVTLSFGTVSCQSTTTPLGIASCSVTAVGAAGPYTVTASFAGDGTYLASTGTGTITIAPKVATTITYTGATQGAAGQPATLSATLTDGSGVALAGKLVTLSFGSVSCQATTNASGVASCAVTVVDGPGSYTVTASFAGDAAYLASTGTGTITLTGKVKTTIVDNTSGIFLQGSTATLKATLTTANGVPLAGKTVSLTLGLSLCTAVTNASGVATCTVTVPGPTGPTLSAAAFAGDAGSVGSVDSKPALVYAFAPGGGSFVVGDGSASGNVTFWGAQWAKVNSVSGGATSSFKGFAGSPATPQCGGRWTSSPGNSSSPPKGPLPAYMAVIVTSAAAKSGSTIGGTIVHVVIVKTNSGYDANPGHAGTGTVVATVC